MAVVEERSYKAMGVDRYDLPLPLVGFLPRPGRIPSAYSLESFAVAFEQAAERRFEEHYHAQ